MTFVFRVKMDIAVASLAVLMEMDGDSCKEARVAAGSVAPTPLRLKKVEEMLTGSKITSELVEQAKAAARDEVTPISDVRADAQYRRQVVGAYMGRALTELSSGE